jgi:D-alanine-D-alanine ligase
VFEGANGPPVELLAPDWRYGEEVMIEPYVPGLELAVTVMGEAALTVTEIESRTGFYDYEAKYLDEGSRLVIPAEIPADVSEQIRRMAIQAFESVDAAGMARVDFFLERTTNRVYINEVNTIPGFTRISMYPKLWEASGLPYRRLLERLIDLAIERFRDKQRSQTAIDSRLLREAEA